jgi:hypothetical protein
MLPNKLPAILIAILFGTLGASVSVAQGLLKADLTGKIPEHKVSSFVILMRPPIGAAAAIVAVVLTEAGILHLSTDSQFVLMAVAFTAGFSERFIVGAVESLAQTASR